MLSHKSILNALNEKQVIDKVSKEIMNYQYILCNQDEFLVDWMIKELIEQVNQYRRNIVGRDFYERSQACIFYMLHVKNLPSIVEHGLLSHNKAYQLSDFKAEDISNQSVNNRRSVQDPFFKKSLHDYVPFYWNPRNAMLYSTQNRFSDNIIILGFEIEKFFRYLIKEKFFLFTNKNAACDNVRFIPPFLKLLLDITIGINLKSVFSASWLYNDDVKQKMMAEILVYESVPFNLVTEIYIQTPEILEQVKSIFQDKGVKQPLCFYGNASNRWSYFFNTKLVF